MPDTTVATTSTLAKHDAAISASGDVTPFDDVIDATDQAIVGIKAITVYEQTVVTGLQVDYLLAGGGTYSAPLRGKADGAKSVVPLAAGEAIVEISARTSGGLASLTIAVTDEAGKAKLYGPYGKGASPLKDGDDDSHDLTFGGTSDQGFSFFGSKAAGLCGQLDKDHKPVGLGVYTIPIVDPGDVSFTSVLSEDFKPHPTDKGKVSTYSNFRTIVTLPSGTSSVDLWAEEELGVTIAGTSYTLDPVKKTTVSPNALGKVVIDVESAEVSVPALKLKTDQMTGRWQWCSIHPDAPAHSKIVGLDADALHNNRDKLGIDAKYSKDDCAHVQAAVASLAKVSAQKATALRHERRLDPTGMDHANWVLDLSAGAVLKAVTAAEAKALSAVAATQKKVGLSLGSLIHKASKVTKVVVSTTEKTATSAASTVAKATTSAAKDTAAAGTSVGKEAVTIGKDVAKSAEQVAKDAVQLEKDFTQATKDLGGDLEHGDFKSFGKDLVTDGLQLGLDVAATGFDVLVTIYTAEGDALVYTLDHCGKYGKLIGGILTAIGVRLEALVAFLRDTHNWKDFILVQKSMLELLDKSAATILAIDTKAVKKGMDAQLDKVKSSANKQIDGMIRKLGGVTGDGKIKTPKELSAAVGSAKSDAGSAASDMMKIVEWPMEKLDWLLSKVLDHIPGMAALEKLVASCAVDTATLLGDIDKAIAAVEKDLLSAVVKSIQDLLAIGKHPSNAPELFVCALLQLGEGILDAGIDIAKGAADAVIDVVGTILKFVLKALKGSIDIPFISDLYKSITGEPLSLLGILSLLLAVPATLIHVAIFGKAPDVQTGLAQSDKTYNYTHIASIITGVAQILNWSMAAWLDFNAIKFHIEAVRTATILAGGDASSAVVQIDNSTKTESSKKVFEWLSWITDVLSQGLGVVTSWDPTKASDDVSNLLWIYGWLPIGLDFVTLRHEGSRLARALSGRRGAKWTALIASVQTLWTAGAIYENWGSQKKPALVAVNSLLGPVTTVFESGMLVAFDEPNPEAAIGVGLAELASGLAQGTMSIVWGTTT